MERPQFESEKGHIGLQESAFIAAIIVISLWAANDFAKDAIDHYYDKANLNQPVTREDINSFENSFNSGLQLTPTPQP